MKRVGDEKKSGESRNMRDQRGAECKERRDPMPRVKMIGGRDLDQFIFAGEFMGQEMEEIKSADDKTRDQTRNRNSKQNAQSDEQLMRSKTGFNCNRSSPEQIETKGYKRDRDRDQRDESDQTIENDGEQGARFVVRRFFEQEIALNNIAAGAAGEKLIVKHPDQKQADETWDIESNLLHAKENLPTDSRSDLDNDIGDDGGCNPAIVGFLQSLAHFMALLWIMKNPDQERDRDRKLQCRDKNFLHPPKRSFQILTER